MVKKRGFTLIELVLVVALIGILTMLAIPSFSSSANYTHKNITNVTHKIFANAIEYWSKDNINPIQKPANFKSINSQGHTVGDYISNPEILKDTNLVEKEEKINFAGKEKIVKVLEEDADKKNVVNVHFEDGVLHTIYKEDNGELNQDISIVFKVFEDIEYNKEAQSTTVSEQLKAQNMLVYTDDYSKENAGYEEYIYKKPKKEPKE